MRCVSTHNEKRIRPPWFEFGELDGLGDGCHACCRNRAVLDGAARRRCFKQSAQGRQAGLRLLELRFQPSQMSDDERIPRGQIRRIEDRFNLLDRHSEVA